MTPHILHDADHAGTSPSRKAARPTAGEDNDLLMPALASIIVGCIIGFGVMEGLLAVA